MSLFRKKSPVKQVTVTLSSTSTFATSFKVPTATKCKVTATWGGDTDHVGSTATKTFKC